MTALQAERYPLAIENFRRVLTANPKSIEAHLNLSEAYRRSGDMNDALVTLEKARQIDPNNPQLEMALGTAYYLAGRRDESRTALQRQLQLQPDNAEAMNNLTFEIVETGGDLNEAKKRAEQAVRKSGNDSHNQDTLGWIYLNRKTLTPTAPCRSSPTW
jgi:Flp pilus assembly protein TadD